jgi:hypothetical protein
MEFAQNGCGQGYYLPLFFFGSTFPQRAERQRFLQRFRGDAHKDTGWNSVTFSGGKYQGFKIISEEWLAHHRDSQK